MRTVVADASLPPAMQQAIADLNSVLADLRRQIAVLEARVKALGG
jgi:hypothetical protein